MTIKIIILIYLVGCIIAAAFTIIYPPPYWWKSWEKIVGTFVITLLSWFAVLDGIREVRRSRR